MNIPETFNLNELIGNLPEKAKAEAKVLLEELGVLESKKKKAKKKDITNIQFPIMEEYNLIVISDCTTCKQVSEYWFRMTFSPDSWGLHSVQVNTRPDDYKIHHTKTDLCAKCEETLMSMSVFDLVARIIDIVVRNRKIPGSHAVLPKERHIEKRAKEYASLKEGESYEGTD